MNHKKYVWPLATQCTLCVFLLTTCQRYEPFTEEEVFRGAYKRNFMRVFGDFAPTQDWDFTDDSPADTRGLSYMTRTDPETPCTIIPTTYIGDANLFESITNNTTSLAKTDKSFALEIEEDACFSIFPVYQNAKNVSGFSWHLQVFVDDQHLTYGYSQKGWPMGTGMFTKKNATASFTDIKDGSCNTWGTKSNSILHYHNEERKKIMYFNLVATGIKDYVDWQFAPKETQQSSLNYQMRLLDIARPADIDSRFETMFIGCEIANFDAAYSNKYKDAKRYRTLVLMIVGPKIPKVVYLENENEALYVPVKQGKRYMIEDMGSSSDFDFNDIVVDVDRKEMRTVTITQKTMSSYNNGIHTTVSLGPSTGDATTSATIRHLCGTKPFQVIVGDYVFGRVTDPTNQEQTHLQLQKVSMDKELYFGTPQTVVGWEPNETATISGWQPDQNNISIRVWRSGEEAADEGGWLVQFPKVGNVPFIMALPETEAWTEEGTTFTNWQRYVPSAY